MKSFIKFSLVISMVWVMRSASSGPVFIANIANPFFQPQYQLVFYTGNLTIPVSTETATITRMSGTFYNMLGNTAAFGQVTGPVLTTQGPLSYYGFLEGSLVANGYTCIALTSIAEPINVALSSSFPLKNSTTQVGLTDIAELCQRYGFATGLVTLPAAYTPVDPQKNIKVQPVTGPFKLLTLPLSLPLSQSAMVGMRNGQPTNSYAYGNGMPTLPEAWFATPLMAYNNTLYEMMTYWQFGYMNKNTPLLQSLSVLPLCTSYQQIKNALFTATMPVSGVNPDFTWTTLDTLTPSSRASQIKALSSEVPYPNPGVNQTSAQVTVVNNPLGVFKDLHTWFVNNVGLQFYLPTKPSPALPHSLVSINDIGATNTYNKAYAGMLQSLAKPKNLMQVSTSNMTSLLTSVAIPVAGSEEGSTMTTACFDATGVYIPLLMADPAVSVQANSHQTASPYYYPTMSAYGWIQKNNKWVVGNTASQQISYAGGKANQEFGMTQETDFDPQKSMMSDFYDALSF